MRGDGLLDGQFRVEPAFPGYGRRPVGPRDVDARRTGPDILPPGIFDRLDLRLARSEQRLRPPLRYRAELLARNDRARASRRLRPVRRAYAPAHGASRPGLYGNTLRLLMRRFLRNDGHGMRAAVFVFGEGGASPPLEEPADDRMLIIRAFRRTISLRTSAEKRKFSVIFVTVN